VTFAAAAAYCFARVQKFGWLAKYDGGADSAPSALVSAG
jgi:hypothetical protein